MVGLCRGGDYGLASFHAFLASFASRTCAHDLGQSHGRPRLFRSVLDIPLAFHSKNGTISHGAVLDHDGAHGHGNDARLFVLL